MGVLERREWGCDELMSLLNALNARTSRNTGHWIIIITFIFLGGQKETVTACRALMILEQPRTTTTQ